MRDSQRTDLDCFVTYLPLTCCGGETMIIEPDDDPSTVLKYEKHRLDCGQDKRF